MSRDPRNYRNHADAGENEGAVQEAGVGGESSIPLIKNGYSYGGGKIKRYTQEHAVTKKERGISNHLFRKAATVY